MNEKSTDELIAFFAQWYCNGSLCEFCKYENYASCADHSERCQERIREVLRGGNNDR